MNGASAFANRTLARQVKRLLGIDDPQGLLDLLALLRQSGAAEPRLAELADRLPAFLRGIEETYAQFDRDILLRTRSLSISSTELMQVNERLRQEAASQQQVVQTLLATARDLRRSIVQDDTDADAVPEDSQDLLGLATLTRDLLTQRERALSDLATSEQRFRTLIRNLPGCVHRTRVDAHSRTVFMSEGIAGLCGRSAADFESGRVSLLSIVEPDDRARVLADLKASADTLGSYVTEFRLRHVDGVERWAYAAGQWVVDGEEYYVDGLILDNTATKVAEREIQRTRTQLFSAINALDVGFAMYDEEERLLHCNDAFRRMNHRIQDLLVPGARLPDLLLAIDQRGLAHHHAEVDEAAWVASELAVRRAGGMREIAEDGRWTRHVDTRSPEGLLVSLRTDITDLKRLTVRMAEARDAAEAATRSKSECLANMRHEIRTPMHGIIGMTALTLETQLAEDQREYLEMVRASAESLLVIINDILDFSKMEAGMLRLEQVPFGLPDLLHQCLKPLGVQAAEKSLEMLYRIAPDVPREITADPGRLRQVLTNLVGNALKFTEQGEVTVDVSVVERRAGDSLLLEFVVRDTGIGIVEEEQQRIFDAFSQADSSVTRRYGGTGLGLAIARRLVVLMGGQIWLSSMRGRGSAFHFTMLARASADAGSAGDQALVTGVLRGRTVLIVDDNATHCHWLGESLGRWGMLPTEVTTAAEAARLLAAGAPGFGAYLIDADLPGESGFDLIAPLRDRQVALSHVWMMVSAANLTRDAARCRAWGLGGYLIKPVQLSALLDDLLRAFSGVQPSEAARLTPSLPSLPAFPEERTVLLVEDTAVNQVLATRLLQKLGYRVTIADNGALAVRMVFQQHFDVVLMDLQMPVMDGLQATTVIRQREQDEGRGRHQVIVAMTANAMEGDREKCLAVGMDGYISKPIDAVRLESEIGRVLDARRHA